MNKRELIELVSEKLGAANNEIKIAFDSFIQKVADSAEVDSALRIPDIGIFHLKKKDSHHNDYTLLFLPLRYDPQGKNKILSFNVKTTKEPELSEGESAFNISIGKPLIPIIGVNRRDFMVQSSYLMLQKTFEERTNDLLAKSVQLTDLKIDPRLIETDDEILDFLEDYGQYEQLSDDTSDIPWDFGLSTEQELSQEHSIVDEGIIDPDEMIIDDVDIKIPVDVLPDFKNAIAEDEINKVDEDETNDKSFQDDSEIQEQTPAVEEIITDEEKIIIREEPEEQDIASIPLEDFYAENLSEEEKDQDEFKIDEADLGFIEEEHSSEVPEDDKSEFSKALYDTDYNEREYDKSDLDEPEYEKPVDEFYSSDISRQEEEEQEIISPRMEVITSFQPGRDHIREDEKPDFKVKYGLWFWVIMVSFIFITISGLYYFLFYKGGNDHNISQNKKASEQNIIERDYDVPVSIIPQADSTAAEEGNSQADMTENNIEENKPVEQSTELPQVRNDIQTGDTKNTLVKEYIFSDGDKFTIQVSSWRTKSVAEDQVRKLQADGFPSYISEFISRNEQKWYRVRVGEYSSLSQAEEFLGKNVNQLFK